MADDAADSAGGGSAGGGGGANLGGGAGTLDVDSGPGAGFIVFATMDDLLDKLKLLEYEKEFIKNRSLGLKPVSRHYFAIPTNPGEQFFTFTSIAAWLIRLSGKSMDQPQEYDDPNSTIATIIRALKELGYPVDFAPNKLKSGCGEYVLYALDKLADESLKKTNFAWKKPAKVKEETEEDIIQHEDEAEMAVDKMQPDDDEEGFEGEDEDDDEALLNLESSGQAKKGEELEVSRPEEIMESTTDSAEWKLEVERVLPSLKVQIRTDNKDWRVHFEQMQTHSKGIESTLVETKQYLEKLHGDISKTLEKIGSREKYINGQLDMLLTEFRALQDKFAETKERYRQASGGVTERSRILADVTDELEKTKQEMEERGSNMTDAAPLVKIKQALTRLRNECVQMDIRIAVLEQVLLQGKLKDKNALQRDMHATAVVADPWDTK